MWTRCTRTGTLLVRAGRFEDAVAPLRRLRALQPGTPDPFAGLAQALTALGSVQEALALAQETARLVPDSAGARSIWGRRCWRWAVWRRPRPNTRPR